MEKTGNNMTDNHDDAIKAAEARGYRLGYKAGYRARTIELLNGFLSTSMGLEYRLLKAAGMLDGMPTRAVARLLRVDDDSLPEIRRCLHALGYKQRMARYKGRVARCWFKVLEDDSLPV